MSSMSLRLLERNMSTGGAGRGRGRGRQKPVPLQQFHQQHPGAPSRPSRISTVGPTSAWNVPLGNNTISTADSEAPQRRVSAPEPRPSAWDKPDNGAPKSAVDEIWDTPPTFVGEISWDSPPQVCPEHNDWADPSDWDTSTELAQACDRLQTNNVSDNPQAPAQQLHGMRQRHEEVELVAAVDAWLAQLGLGMHREAVLAWCRSMGAGSLEEVVENVSELSEAEDVKFTTVQKRRLLLKAQEALEIVESGNSIACSVATLEDSDAERPVEDDSLSVQSDGADGSEANLIAGTHSAQVRSFYSSPDIKDNGFSAEQHSQDCEENVTSSTSVSYYSTDRCPQPSKLPQDKKNLKPQRKIVQDLENREQVTIFTKQNKTEIATWEPKLKVSQSKKKKEPQKPSRPDPAEVTRETDSQKAAKLKLERQLQASEALKSALQRKDGERVRSLLEEHKNDLDKDDKEQGHAFLVSFVSEKLQSAVQQRDERLVQELFKEELLSAQDRAIAESMLKEEADRRRGLEAVQRIQDVTEAPLDKEFGAKAKSALQEEALAKAVKGGSEAIESLRVKLRIFDRRQEAKGALALTINKKDPQALQVAIDEAYECGLSGEELLVAEAVAILEKIQHDQRVAAEAEERMQRLLQASDPDPDELERAIEECERLRIPVAYARESLAKLKWQRRERERQRTDAAEDLRSCLKVGNLEAIKTAIQAAKDAGVEDALLQQAEAKLVAIKRRDNALVELCIAREKRSPRRLKAAIDEAQAVGVEVATLEAAKDDLQQVEEDARHRQQVYDMLQQAIGRRDLDSLYEAIQAGESVLPSSELTKARIFAEELEAEAHEEKLRIAISSAKERLIAAIEHSDFRGIQARQRELLELGIADDEEVLLQAHAKLEALRDEHEASEASECIEATEARIQELKRREAQLVGAANKKERTAIGKEIMSLKNDSEYLSALRFIRDQDAERKRRADNARRAEEKVQRVEQKRDEASRELQRAFDTHDEAKVRSLLDKDILSNAEIGTAEAWLAEQVERCSSAQNDAAILEFSYRHLLKRDFNMAIVAMNDFLVEQYKMQEGTCFKLRQVRACSSVLVAFRSAECAEVVLRSAHSLAQKLPSGHSSAVVASAEVHGRLSFNAGVEEYLSESRQDAENLRRIESRPHSNKEAKQRADEKAKQKADEEAQRRAEEEARRRAEEEAKRKADEEAKRKAEEAPSLPVPAAAKIVKLSEQAVAALKADRSKATSLDQDLKHFTEKFGIKAERYWLSEVRLTPMTNVHLQDFERAREELQQILEYNFPQTEEQELRYRNVRLNVSADRGACIELLFSDEGYFVNGVEDYPGQSFCRGEVIAEINGVSLAGLDEETLEETFGNEFGDGASLLILSRRNEEA